MARLMSLIIIIFLAVPVIAPTMGPDRDIHRELARDLPCPRGGGCCGVHLGLDSACRETLQPENSASPFIPATIFRNWKTVVTDRLGFGPR